MKNKLLSIVVLLIALLQLSVIKCFAYVYSGTCGSNLTWNLDTSTKVLQISGTGSMNYYSAGGPWMSYKSSIETIIIEEGVTSIGNKAFYGGNFDDKFSTLKNVYIPSTIQAINDMAFYCCDNIESVYIADIDAWSQVYLPSLQACPFQYNTKLYNSEGMELTEIYFSNGMTEIKDYTFYNCKSIKKVHLPNSVQIIGENTFRSSGVESINLDNCVTLERYAFCNASNLKDVGNVSKVQVLGDAVFYGVNVPLLNLSACQSMGYYVFDESADNIKSIIINRTSIPTFPSSYDGYGFLTARDWDNYGKEEFITTIYVPEASVSEYKSHKIFSTVADHIKPFVITETLNLNASEIHVTMGESKQLIANVSALNGTPSIREVVWSSNNEEVAMVTEDGNVLAKSCGVAIITAKTQDGSNLSKQCTVTVNAPNNSMYVSAVKAHAGSAFSLPIYMSNDMTIANTQCDLYLPEGMSVKFDEDEEAYLINKGERLKTAHSVSCKKQTNGSYRIMVTSLNNSSIKDTDKTLPVMYVPIEVASTVSLGNYNVSLKDIILNSYNAENFTSTLFYPIDTEASISIEPVDERYVVELIDGTNFTNNETKAVDELTFSKTFSASSVGKWNAFYVPMSIDVEEYAGELDFAEIYAFCATVDTNGDGTVDANDENFLFVRPVKTGCIEPNVPYLIRPKAAKTYIINSADNVLYKSTEGKVEFSTTLDKFTVTGLNNAFTVTAGDNNYYVSASGALNIRTTGSTTVKANRWIMHRESKKYGGANDGTSYAREYRIVTIGEDMDETTAIETIRMSNTSNTESNDVYTIDGRRVNAEHGLSKGIYIKNGKKYFVK